MPGARSASRHYVSVCLFGAVTLAQNLGDDARADGQTAFTDGELRAFFQRHRGNQLDFQFTLSPGMTISTPSGRLTVPVTSIVRM